MTPKRFLLWESKLLDLTLRNSLLNTSYGSNCLELTNRATADFFNEIQQMNSIRLYSANSEERQENKGLHSVLDKDEMEIVAKKVSRSASSNLSEVGSAQLFLCLGMLHWVDNIDPMHPNNEPKKSFAPIILVPVTITRNRTTGIFYVHPTSEDPMVNVTLIELLKQNHDRDLSDLITLVDETIDYSAIIERFAKMAASKEGWSVTDECCLGIFLFSKFVLWNDIHSNVEKIRSAMVVEALIEKRRMLNDELMSDARLIEHNMFMTDLALPLSADSSQIEAVADIEQGKSFLLYGPPGTGKSQTITNITANSLYKDKNVLFVAQKRAALEVVKHRLQSIGLAPFCIELHSNKSTKPILISQLSKLFELKEENFDEQQYNDLAAKLTRHINKITAYIEAVHSIPNNNNQSYSLADCINECIRINESGMMLALDEKVLLSTSNMELEEIATLLEEMETIRSSFGDITHYPLFDFLPKDSKRSNLDIVQSKLIEIRKTLVDISLSHGFFSKLFRLPSLKKKLIRELLELDDLAINPLSVCIDNEERKQMISRWLSNWNMAGAWGQWSARYCRIATLGYRPVADAIAKAYSDELTDMVRYEINRARAMFIIENNDNLVMFNGLLFDKVIEKYKELAKQYQEMTAQYLFFKLNLRVRQVLESKDPETQKSLTSIRTWIANHGRTMSIRTLFARHGNTIRKMCPCMLMSPISVAQFLPIDQEPFDVVLFDEASQIPTAEAVGAMARAKAVAIVGDPKQMPPTAFFQMQLTDEDPENNDMDSVLEDCIALGMTAHHLNCHYRSKHESLIAFSNHYFYGDKLITFPSVDDRDCRVQYQFVNSVYDHGKSRTNRQEAEAVVDEIIRRLSDEQLCKHSIGVIAFSQGQQEMIEDILQERIGRNHELASIANGDDVSEPLFVKNLENVQGDERDVILFSIGYGRQANGKISMNFGPINQDGGIRRLNVAVTRAREQIIVFTNMNSEDIDLQRSDKVGVMALRNFLYYAQHGTFPIEKDAQEIQMAIKQRTEPIANAIAQALRVEGYQCDLSVGRSNLKIDVAVLDKKCPNRYKLGIMIDGRNYYASPMVRDREIIQPLVLQELGWELFKVWQVDYFKNPNQVVKRIIERLQA